MAIQHCQLAHGKGISGPEQTHFESCWQGSDIDTLSSSGGRAVEITLSAT